MTANSLGDFLRAHREGLQPSNSHAPQQKRRTPGLRREEVAVRAAISTDYYTRLEQGRERRPSAQVIDALAAALELTSAEASYLHGLVTPRRNPRDSTPPDGTLNDFLVLTMHSWRAGPAYIVDQRSDVLGRNDLAQNLFGETENILRMLFLEPGAQNTWVDWEMFARFIVGGIRRNIGPHVRDDPATDALIAELSSGSPAFAQLWESYEIEVRQHKEKTLRHREFGEITMDFEILTAIDTPNQFLILHRTPVS